MDETRRINATFPIETDNDLWEYLKQFPKKKRAGKLKFYARLGLMIQKANEDAEPLELLSITQEIIGKMQRKPNLASFQPIRNPRSKRKSISLNTVASETTHEIRTQKTTPDTENVEDEADMFAGISIAAAIVTENRDYDPFADMVGEADPEVVNAFLEYSQTDSENEKT